MVHPNDPNRLVAVRYFDHNATAPLHPVARDAWLRTAEQFFGNPSSPHRIGGRAEAALEEARSRLAHLLGCDAMDLVWTSGATESNNLVLHHFVETTGPNEAVWVSSMEHPSVIQSAQARFGDRCRLLPVSSDGVVDVARLSRDLAMNRPGLVAVMAANNVTGMVQPWREIQALCRDHGVPFFCDAVQWLGRLPAAGLGACDWLTGCLHKAGGPRGTGFLKCSRKAVVRPQILGGPQEKDRRAGTENVAGAVALVAALEAREARMQDIPARSAMRGRFVAELTRCLPGSRILCPGGDSLWNTVAVLMPQTDCPQRWVVKLDKLGFAVSTGSACSSGKEEPSPVLLAMGFSPEDASRMLRLSGGWETSEEDWSALLEGMAAAAKELGVVASG